MIEFSVFTLIKVSISILVVVLLSLIAEWAGPRVAGIASGYPLGAAISLFFYGVENGRGFAARSALFTAAGLAATVAFVAGYLLGIRLAGSRGRPVALPASILLGLAAYGLAAWLLSFIPVNWISAPCIAAAAMALSAWCFRRIPDMRIEDSPRQAAGNTLAIAVQNRIQLGYTVAFLRAGFAAAVILVITSVAGVVGPRWAGFFSAFPMTMLPLLAIIQFTYQPDYVRTIIKNVPRGLGSLLVYAMIVAASTTAIGIGWATVLGYLAATVYLFLMEFGIHRRAAGVKRA